MSMSQEVQSYVNGITDDRYLGDGFCGDAEGVDIRYLSRGVRLANNTRETGIFDTSGMGAGSAYRIYAMLDFYNGSATSKVYGLYPTGIIDTTNGNTFSYSGGLTGARNFVRVESDGVNYGVILRAQGTNGIWRWNDDSGPNMGSAAAYMNLSNNTSDYRPILVDGGYMYVGGNGTVDAINITTSTWVKDYTCNIPGDCRAIELISDQIVIYSGDGVDGWKMIWDGVDSLPAYVQKWADNPVLNVANMGDYDVAITGTGEFVDLRYRRLFQTSGFGKELFYGSDFIESEKQLFYFSPIFTNAIEVTNNMVWIGGRHCIYTFGKSKASLPSCLTKDIIISDSEQVVAMYLQSGAYMYVSYYTSAGINKIIKQDIRPGRKYGTTGYICTLALDGGNVIDDKSISTFAANCYLPAKGSSETSIDIYARIDDTKEWIFNCVTPSETPAEGAIYTLNGLSYVVVSYDTTRDELLCTREANGPYNDRVQRAAGTLVKSSGPGSANVVFTNVTNYKYITSITGMGKQKPIIPIVQEYQDIEFKVVLNSTNETISPIFYGIKPLFNYVGKQDG